MRYTLPDEILYTSQRYGKTITVPEGYVSDGASGAVDIYSYSWFVHDWVKGNYLGSGPKPSGKLWDDGTVISNLQASYILHDILVAEGRWIRARIWFMATLIWGSIVR